MRTGDASMAAAVAILQLMARLKTDGFIPNLMTRGDDNV